MEGRQCFAETWFCRILSSKKRRSTVVYLKTHSTIFQGWNQMFINVLETNWNKYEK